MPISIITVKRLISESKGVVSFADSANYAISSSHAMTASYYQGSISNAVNADNAISASHAITASYALVAQNVLGTILSASYAVTASYLNNDPTIFKQTGSYWNTTRNIGITGSLQMNFNGASDFFSVVVSGEEKLQINTEGTLQLSSQIVPPTAVAGGIFYSASDAFFIGFNT